MQRDEARTRCLRRRLTLSCAGGSCSAAIGSHGGGQAQNGAAGARGEAQGGQ